MNPPRKPAPSRATDRAASSEWQRARGAGARRAPTRAAATPLRRAPAWEVTPADLACLDAVRSLLRALNDAYVSTHQIQTLILDIPVLAARCVRRVGVKQPVTPEALARALTTIGNMGLEAELLGLLEDLTTCRADLQDAEASDRTSDPPG